MNQTKELFTKRRAVTFFDTTKDVSDELLKEIYDLAMHAPSAFNLQPWKVLAVRTPEAKKKLRAVSFDQAKIEEAPVTLVILGDREGYSADNPEWEAKVAAFGNREQVDGYRQFAGMLYGASDVRKLKFAESNAGLFAMSFMYAAQAFGVDTHAMSGVDFDAVKAAFEIEDRYEVVMLISVGYLASDKQLYPRMARRSYDELVTAV